MCCKIRYCSFSWKVFDLNMTLFYFIRVIGHACAHRKPVGSDQTGPDTPYNDLGYRILPPFLQYVVLWYRWLMLKKQIEILFRLICVREKYYSGWKNNLKSTYYKRADQGRSLTRLRDVLTCEYLCGQAFQLPVSACLACKEHPSVPPVGDKSKAPPIRLIINYPLVVKGWQVFSG
jgi:hypothetical protein